MNFDTAGRSIQALLDAARSRAEEGNYKAAMVILIGEEDSPVMVSRGALASDLVFILACAQQTLIRDATGG